MLRAHAERDESRGDTLQPGNRVDDARKQWNAKRPISRLEGDADEFVLDDNLHGLRHSYRKLAPAAHGVELVFGGAAIGQSRGQQVSGRDRVLDSKVDADAADRRHRVRGIANAK